MNWPSAAGSRWRTASQRAAAVSKRGSVAGGATVVARSSVSRALMRVPPGALVRAARLAIIYAGLLVSALRLLRGNSGRGGRPPHPRYRERGEGLGGYPPPPPTRGAPLAPRGRTRLAG